MEKLKKILQEFRGKKVIVIGDVMLDKYVDGEVKRISPEAPVPVLQVKNENYVPGGAANVAMNVASLGGSVSLFGFIGEDIAGEILSKLLMQNKIDFFPSFCEKTTEKIRATSDGHQFIRLDYEEIEEKKLDNSILDEEIRNADVILVSDYAKGAINNELMQKLKNYDKKIIVDPKPQNSAFYEGVFLIKLNEGEALRMSNVNDVREAGKRLRERFGSSIIVTRGSRGMIIFDGGVKEIPAVAKEVYDVTGAGDTVLATLALSIASGAALEQAAILANHAAGIVVEKAGTATTTTGEIEKRIFQEESKIKTKEELMKIVREQRERGKKFVWTNGCFDLLHIGHVKYLQNAKKLGDFLIVGLNSDESVKKLKGPSRPLQPEDERAEILSSLEFVDYVLIFPETSVENYLYLFKPDVFAKGGDYTLEKLNQDERKIVEDYGGKIALISLVEGKSTTNIINMLKER